MSFTEGVKFKSKVILLGCGTPDRAFSSTLPPPRSSAWLQPGGAILCHSLLSNSPPYTVSARSRITTSKRDIRDCRPFERQPRCGQAKQAMWDGLLGWIILIC
jgi:hypothetical protein